MCLSRLSMSIYRILIFFVYLKRRVFLICRYQYELLGTRTEIFYAVFRQMMIVNQYKKHRGFSGNGICIHAHFLLYSAGI